MRLTIVIPAYNEEDAIGRTIDRCLAAAPPICVAGPVSDVELIVVSDGSTDRTVEIAGQYPQVRLIVFPENRGYGAAIKRGFAESTGDLLAFLDADGTCDPEFFGPMCAALADQGADIAIGSRLGPGSRMPRIRRVGNRIYAFLLGALSNRAVSDTASGMRVIRRTAIAELYPLPDGLNFTPAMSARVLLDERLKMVEVPMSYEERIGRSKLSVLRDGMRFLRTILEMTLVWRPARLFLGAGFAMLLTAVLLAASPIETWWREGVVHEGMIYRLLFCGLLLTMACTLTSSSVVAERLSRLLLERSTPQSFWDEWLEKLFGLRGVALTGSALSLGALWLVGPGVMEFTLTRHVTIHWSRIVPAGVLVFCAAQLGISALLLHGVQLYIRRCSERELFPCPSDAACRPATPLAAPGGRRGVQLPEPPVVAIPREDALQAAIAPQ